MIQQRLLRNYPSFWDDQFAPQAWFRSFVVSTRVGILFVGRSGIGKSEVLGLVERGHRLVGDDVIMLPKSVNHFDGNIPSLAKHFMEIRGIGIIDIRADVWNQIRFQKSDSKSLRTLKNGIWTRNTPALDGEEATELLGVEIPSDESRFSLAKT